MSVHFKKKRYQQKKNTADYPKKSSKQNREYIFMDRNFKFFMQVNTSVGIAAHTGRKKGVVKPSYKDGAKKI